MALAGPSGRPQRPRRATHVARQSVELGNNYAAKQVTRLSSCITDEPTIGRFRRLAEELQQKLQRAVARRKAWVEERTIRGRAKRIWEERA
jgi:hypothetical protein